MNTTDPNSYSVKDFVLKCNIVVLVDILCDVIICSLQHSILIQKQHMDFGLNGIASFHPFTNSSVICCMGFLSYVSVSSF